MRRAEPGVSASGAAPSAVRDLQLRSPGRPSGLQAAWGAGPGQRGGHRLLLYHPESRTLARNVSAPPDALSYNFSGLRAGSEYVLEVATWAGHLQAKTSARQWTGEAGASRGPRGRPAWGRRGRPKPPGRAAVSRCGRASVPAAGRGQGPVPGPFSSLASPPDPVPPGQLELRALGPGALQASWNGSDGAAWLHLVLRDLLGGANLTAAVRRGVSSHTFRHLAPGTPYELTLSAAAGPHRAAGPRAAEWTRECSACAGSWGELTERQGSYGLGLTFWDVQKGHRLRAPGKASWGGRASTTRSEPGQRPRGRAAGPGARALRQGVASSRSRGLGRRLSGRLAPRRPAP